MRKKSRPPRKRVTGQPSSAGLTVRSPVPAARPLVEREAAVLASEEAVLVRTETADRREAAADRRQESADRRDEAFQHHGF